MSQANIDYLKRQAKRLRKQSEFPMTHSEALRQAARLAGFNTYEDFVRVQKAQIAQKGESR